MFAVFPCYPGETGPDRMSYDPKAECGDYGYITGLSIAVIVLMTGLAAYTLGFGMAQRKSDIAVAMVDGDDEVHRALRQQYGFLFLEYKPEYLMWELLTFGRKCGVMVIAKLTPADYDMSNRMILLISLMSCSLVLQVHFRPQREANPGAIMGIASMDMLAQSCSLASLVLAQHMYTSSHTQGSQGRIIATLAFVFVNALLASVFVVRGARPAKEYVLTRWQTMKRWLQRCFRCFRSQESKHLELKSKSLAEPLLDLRSADHTYNVSAELVSCGNNDVDLEPHDI